MLLDGVPAVGWGTAPIMLNHRGYMSAVYLTKPKKENVHIRHIIYSQLNPHDPLGCYFQISDYDDYYQRLSKRAILSRQPRESSEPVSDKESASSLLMDVIASMMTSFRVG